MNHRTVAVVLPAPADEVFHYLSPVENLPDWATDFAQELKILNGSHKIVNGLGEFFFRIGRAAFTFTMFQAPDVPFELFEGQYWSLLREMDNIRHRFGAAA